MLPDADDPVVLLSEGVWHIVAHSRRSYTAVCGKTIGERRAHTRLSQRRRSQRLPPLPAKMAARKREERELER